MAQTDEHAFEAYLETVLVGPSGWASESKDGWDPARALFPAVVLRTAQALQPDVWGELAALLGPALEGKVLEALGAELATKGTLHVLRHGFKFYGRTLRLAAFRPATGLNPDALALYAKNVLTVTRQARISPASSHTLDLLFAVGGLPVATCELKNPATGQTWREGVEQVRARDPRAEVFAFKRRAVVHFVADPNEVHMTTRMEGPDTAFLPFNRGSHPGEVRCGAGNPQHPSGHRTGYFWEDVLHRDSFLDLLHRFVFVEKRETVQEDGKGKRKTVVYERTVFPRYHQLDAVRGLEALARRDGPGHSYLIQHSAGSGKTNSIAWLTHRLASLHDADDRRVFDCVVVITDRKVLDAQLQDAIYQIEHARGVVKAIDENAHQLAEALVDGTPIVITTLQKFPFVMRGLLRAAGGAAPEQATDAQKAQAKAWEEALARRRYAIVVDEAHSSQTGESARELKTLLGSGKEPDASASPNPIDPEAGPTWEDTLNRIMESRVRQANLSFFAFTATPKGKTVELFGKVLDGHMGPHHLYSMRQAIEEGFILDVLTQYTLYTTYYQILKAAEDDPKVLKKKGAKALAKFLVLHPHNVEQKTEIIIEHFRKHVRHRLGGKAKAMVVTASRLQAVRYMRAFERYLALHGIDDVRPLVAFSGTVRDPEDGLDYTEAGMNVDVVTGRPIGEARLPERFASSDYQILLVANKYQTGFDQPLLHTMYVDKRLDGVQAVQTLSRLNRMVPGKDAPFVLDFVNAAEDIYGAFKPYYDRTLLDAPSDPAQLERLRHEILESGVVHDPDVEAFAQVFYKPVHQQTAADHPTMQKHLQSAVDRFKALDEDAQDELRDRLSGFVSLFAFLSQILPYADRDLELLYSYARFLLPELPSPHEGGPLSLGDRVALQYHRIDQVFSGAIEIKEGDEQYVTGLNALGTGTSRDAEAPLSEIIGTLNDRFGTSFTDEDRLFFEQIHERAKNSEAIRQTAQANTFDKFELSFRKAVETLMVERMQENDAIVERYLSDADFQNSAFRLMARSAYDALRKEANPSTP